MSRGITDFQHLCSAAPASLLSGLDLEFMIIKRLCHRSIPARPCRSSPRSAPRALQAPVPLLTSLGNIADVPATSCRVPGPAFQGQRSTMPAPRLSTSFPGQGGANNDYWSNCQQVGSKGQLPASTALAPRARHMCTPVCQRACSLLSVSLAPALLRSVCPYRRLAPP